MMPMSGATKALIAPNDQYAELPATQTDQHGCEQTAT